jgi:hypothetical protein
MLKHKIRNPAKTVITIASATVLTALGATGASAAARMATQSGHVGVAANTVQAAAGANGSALTHVPATLTVPAPVSGKALASPMPVVSDNSSDSSDCETITLPNNSGTFLAMNDPGLHQDIRITTNSTTCYTFQTVPGTQLVMLRINGGADCVKIVYPDANENEYAVDEGCNNNDPLERFSLVAAPNVGFYICNLTYGECLAVSAALNDEIVGGKQQGPSVWY